MSDDDKGKNWRNNPMFVSAAMITVVIGGISAISNLSGMYDSQHTSELELGVVRDIALRNSADGECRYLDLRILLIEDSIWDLEQESVPSQRLAEKQRELRNLTIRFNELRCAAILG